METTRCCNLGLRESSLPLLSPRLGEASRRAVDSREFAAIIDKTGIINKVDTGIVVISMRGTYLLRDRHLSRYIALLHARLYFSCHYVLFV